MNEGCVHLGLVREVTPNSDGCETCRAIGDTWVHLRLCMTCGNVGCCDDSKNKHAHKHSDETGHPVIRSFEQGEFWMWCYLDHALLLPD
ncbi:MAG TPA: UBP-type zinc finger domain-containing protein [Anaerolineales bacterium]|nr:UBP-type zinc finger domain-containing protein [Anaerolineales bacterium]